MIKPKPPEPTNALQKPSEKENKLAAIVAKLSERDVEALRYFQKEKQAEISPAKAETFYLLFQQGVSCEEIRRLNHPAFSLGQIIAARVRDNWDARKEEHAKKLFEESGAKVGQVQLEMSQFLSDMLAASMKLHHDKIKRYLQTDDVSHLKGTPLEDNVGFRKMSEIILALQQVTGQDKKKVVEHRGGMTINHNNSTTKRISSDEAADVLEALVVESEGK